MNIVGDMCLIYVQETSTEKITNGIYGFHVRIRSNMICNGGFSTSICLLDAISKQMFDWRYPKLRY